MLPLIDDCLLPEEMAVINQQGKGFGSFWRCLLILVERLELGSNCCQAKPLSLAWSGENSCALEVVWRQYLRRFAIDHWYRFAKQTLHWTLPNLSTPEQCDRWSDLMPIMTWQLWLARDIVTDHPLPWQKKLTQLTPGRVAQSMGSIFAVIHTPASSPKLRGKSHGWKKGQMRQRRIHYPIVKKSTSKSPKITPDSA